MKLFVSFFRKFWYIIFCLGNVIYLPAQKSDYIWLSGYSSNAGFDTAQNTLYGTSVMNFNYTPRSIYYDTIMMNFDKTNVSFCDSNGNLLFYSNGIYVANALDEMIENSDSLNAGWLQYVWDPGIATFGYRNVQGLLAFRDIVNPDYYYLVYSFTDSVPGSDGGNVYSPNVYVALLDMGANAGLGRVMYKNKSVISDSLGWELTATKHGNGRDWWVLAQKRNTNCYYRFLIDSSGINPSMSLTCAGQICSFNSVGAACFSPDGSKYVYFNNLLYNSAGLNIFDFDRCTGVISNPVYIPIPVVVDSEWLGMGVAISPNNRFLYVMATKQAYQFDLTAGDIAGSIDTVAIYDGYRSPFGSYFNTAQIGPDGKIYISCGNAETDYHVINNPDAKGDSCNFVQHGIPLPTFSWGVPNFPNYRLGALTASQCDSLSGLDENLRAEKEKIIRVYPNPASDYTIVDYGFTDWNKGQPTLQICNALGQTIYTQLLPMYSGFQKIDVSGFAVGLYTVFIKRRNGVVASNKLVVLH